MGFELYALPYKNIIQKKSIPQHERLNAKRAVSYVSRNFKRVLHLLESFRKLQNLALVSILNQEDDEFIYSCLL